MGFRTWASALVVGAAVVTLTGCGLVNPEPNASVEPDRSVSEGAPGAGANIDGVSAQGKGGKITRSAVIKRAKSWPAAGVPYCLGYPLSQCVGKNYTNAYGTYRADCSGFVSMAWNLSSSLTTSSLPSVATRINKSQLKAGDILNKSGVHVVVFEKWANSAKTAYWAYEQTPPRAIYHKIPYPYHNGGSGYLPYRYKNIVDDTGATAANAKSVNADAYGDIVSVDSARAMWLYPGKSSGTFGKRVRIGQGWTTAYNRIAVGDANADGRGDLFATATDGKLYYWQRTAKGFSNRINVGAGWKSIRWFAVADVNGDRRSDLLSLNGSTLYLQTGKGNGRFNTARLLGKGWSKYNRIVAGDVNGDGYADLHATTSSGELHYFSGTGPGSFAYKGRTGKGWASMSRILAVDVNGDRKLDLLGVRSDGAMYYYRGSGTGGFAKAVRLGGGWSSLRVATW
jgi:hypothetical protein